MIDVINKNKDKKVCVVSHGTALSVMLSKWCELKVNNDTKYIEIYFNNNMVFDGNWNVPELFKLVFDGEQLISIENIR